MPKYTIDDVKRLAASFRKAKSRSKAFALLTGAGCSFSAGIPLAPALAKQILEEYGEQIRHRVPEERRNDYGACMGCLTPTERRDLLKPILDAANVNWGHIAIAAMMDGGWISRVLTFNFDSILARACGICGTYPATYDFGAAPSATLEHIVSPSIIHLHGQSYGVVMFNTEEETLQHAKEIEPLLRDTLDGYPLLIIGYSGNSDSVYPRLVANFKGKERLIWADYDVEPNAKMSEFIAKKAATSEFLGGIDSDVFLIELARELGSWPPLLFSSFEDHLLREIGPVLDYPKDAGGGEDLVSDLRVSLLSSKDTRAPAGNREFERLMLLGNWDAVVAKASEAKTPKDKDQVAWAFVMQGNALTGLAKQKQDESLYRESFGKYEAALKFKPDDHEALNNWGDAASGLWHLTHDDKLLPQVLDLAQRAEAIGGKPNYNVACALALMAHEAQCEVQLQRCKDAGTLPKSDHLKTDIDLAAYWDRDWFKALLS